jgi:hypothetical protein
VGKPEEKRPLGRPRHRCVDNIKTDLKKIGWHGMDRTGIAQVKDQLTVLVNTVINVQVP